MFENIRLAFQGIWSHKMRSFLTMLGIIIGIASIIAIVSTIKGTSEQIKEDLIGSGPKCLIRAVPPRSGGYTSASKAPGKPAKSTASGKGNNVKGGTSQKAGGNTGKAPAAHSAKASRNARPASSGKKR